MTAGDNMFLQRIHPDVKVLIIALGVLAVFSLFAINFINPIYVLGIDVAALVLLLFIKYIHLGFYLMVFFYPFVDWQFIVGSANVPYVDLIALFVFTAFVIKTLLELKVGDFSRELVKEKAPGILFAVAFWVVAALSLWNVTILSPLWPAFKYWMRPIVFFYLMFVVLPYNLINSKAVLKITLQILFGLGLLVGIDGFMSILFGTGPWYTHRAIPFPIFGHNLLGGNQNAIAEVLVVAIPIAIILFLLSSSVRVRGWYAVSVIFMTLVLLWTFSRSGWLALMIMLLILFFVKNKHKMNWHTLSALAIVLVFIPLLLYFSFYQNVDWVRISNSNRILVTQVSLHNFLQHPIIGNGLGTFQQIVGSTFAYLVEFGDPLDSHGFAQKLLVETGALGLLSFVLLLGYLFYQYLRGYWQAKDALGKSIILCFIAMFCGIVFFELFSTSYFIAKMWLPIGVGLAGAKLFSGRLKLG